MDIPLDQFEQIIDETILKRGYDYFKRGLVEATVKLSPGHFTAIVQGSESYEAEVTIQDEIVTNYSCTCPYDMGPVCKHVVALLFALQEEIRGMNMASGKTIDEPASEKEKKTKQKTVNEQVDEILTQAPVESLVEFIRERCIQDTAFCRLFMAQFTHHLEGESKGGYAQRVKSILTAAKGRHGFIEWDRTMDVGRAVNELLVTARKQFEIRNFRTTLLITCAVLEEMTKALQFADDSDGSIGGSIMEALDILDLAASEDLPEEHRKWLFDDIVVAVNKRVLEGWDWDLDILFIAAKVMQGDKETSILMKLAETISRSEFEKERVQELVSVILRKSGRLAEAEKFEANHMKNPVFRELAIKKAMEKGDLDRAKDIAQEGLRLDQKNKPGLADNWVDWLLKIAIELRDTETIIAHARYLLSQSNRDHMHYYQILKSYVTESEWSSFINELIKQLSAQGGYSDLNLLAWICVQEERWETLLEVCNQHFSLKEIREYEKYLAARYPLELAGIYKQKILELLENNTGRIYYREAARYVRRMKKMGAVILTEGLIKQLREKYRLRRALLEILENV
ncbi:MAG: SWIM zinc finger family protein [Bacteroidales bacterium]|jgi:hypothetical protein